ncbi:MAG: hypothetical protein M1831_005743 [Alyxoria varia]|nr:MAG: hypothetical protein M1831_005743 [Alyxoria varia]
MNHHGKEDMANWWSLYRQTLEFSSESNPSKSSPSTSNPSESSPSKSNASEPHPRELLTLLWLPMELQLKIYKLSIEDLLVEVLPSMGLVRTDPSLAKLMRINRRLREIIQEEFYKFGALIIVVPFEPQGEFRLQHTPPNLLLRCSFIRVDFRATGDEIHFGVQNAQRACSRIMQGPLGARRDIRELNVTFDFPPALFSVFSRPDPNGNAWQIDLEIPVIKLLLEPFRRLRKVGKAGIWIAFRGYDVQRTNYYFGGLIVEVKSTREDITWLGYPSSLWKRLDGSDLWFVFLPAIDEEHPPPMPGYTYLGGCAI